MAFAIRKLNRKKGDMTMIADETLLKDSNLEENREQLCELFRKLVPFEGKADTIAGEIVRAINRIGGRYWHELEQFGYWAGKETVNPAGRYLMEKCGPAVRNAVKEAWCTDYGDPEYEQKLGVLMAAILEYLNSHPELETTKNTEDMFDLRDENKDIDRGEEDEWEAWDYWDYWKWQKEHIKLYNN